MILINYDVSKCNSYEQIEMKNLYDNWGRCGYGDYYTQQSFIYYDSFEELFESVDDEKYNEIQFMGFYFENSDYVNYIVNDLVLPSSLYQLSCDHNNLSKLPELPEGLNHLHCPYNNITRLPKLPNSLEVLYCYSNCIEYLESLPDNLISICASHNKITKITNFPKLLQYIECQYNKLKYLPELPNEIIGFNANNNELIDIPNNFNAIFKYIKYIQNYRDLWPDKSWPDKSFTFQNNPVHTLIKYKFNGNIETYINWRLTMHKKYVRRLEDWYLECKYNPEYLICRKRIEKEYNEIFNN